MTTHRLKTWPEPFAALKRGDKTAEFRRDDRGFEVGHLLVLEEWEEGTGYSGDRLEFRITDISRGGRFGIPEGYAMLSLARGSSPPDLSWKFGDEAIITDRCPVAEFRGCRVVLNGPYTDPASPPWIGYRDDGHGLALYESEIVRPEVPAARPDPATDRAASDLMLRLEEHVKPPEVL